MELSKTAKPALYTIIDANLNRAKEGLRVCEDIARFSAKSAPLSKRLKNIRHLVSKAAAAACPDYSVLISNRDSASDVGRRTNIKSEFKRGNIHSVIAANFKRAQESLRVLEETSKLISPQAAASFKEARYMCYEAEKIMITSERKKI